jgi:hypothetical protein
MNLEAKRLEKNLKQREYRKRNSNIATLRYEKTKKGSLVRTYRNMKSRVEGVLRKKAHLYEGKEMLDKEEFYSWSLDNKEFHNLFSLWVISGYNMKLTPSIDRIDTGIGYLKDNMQWLTHSENSSKGSISRHNKGNIHE